jgi:hypothetical protein
VKVGAGGGAEPPPDPPPLHPASSSTTARQAPMREINFDMTLLIRSRVLPRRSKRGSIHPKESQALILK